MPANTTKAVATKAVKTVNVDAFKYKGINQKALDNTNCIQVKNDGKILMDLQNVNLNKDVNGIYIPDTSTANNLITRFGTKQVVACMVVSLYKALGANQFVIKAKDNGNYAMAVKQTLSLCGMASFVINSSAGNITKDAQSYNLIYVNHAYKGMVKDCSHTRWVVSSQNKILAFSDKDLQIASNLLIQFISLSTGNSIKAIKDHIQASKSGNQLTDILIKVS